MSGASRRLHEEGSHLTPLKRPHDGTSLLSKLSGKVVPSPTNDFHQPCGPGQDGRLAKVQRIELRDVDKRSSLLRQMSSSSNNSCLDHLITFDNKLELRDIRDARDNKTENRETKTDSKELFRDTRMDPQGSKSDGGTRPDSRVDGKQLRFNRESHSDFEGDIQLEKGRYSAANSHLNRKDPGEHQRPKKYSEFPSDDLDSWHVTRDGLHSIDEVGEDSLAADEGDFLEVQKTVRENKIDLKGEELSREKDRKRKDEKSKDWGERDKERNDHQNNLQLACTRNEHNELVREEREMERSERERKVAQKDKGRKDGEKDSIKRDSSNANGKKNLHSEKELVDGSMKISKQEITALEPKGIKNDSRGAFNMDFKDKKGERDVIMRVRHERHGRSYDKEPDDGCAEGDGVIERDREAFGYAVCQPKRMLRSRGTSQTPDQEPCFQSRARENEGSQGKFEVSTLVYKPGECMQELLKSWKEFEASKDGKNEESLQNGPTLEIRIPTEYVTYKNHRVRYGKLWGTDIYTDDSDLVGVLIHTGYCHPTSSPPPSTIQELRATIRLLPPQDYYTSTVRNDVRSCAWGAGICCSFRVERCCIVKEGGETVDLEPCLTHMSTMEPTLIPMSVERTMATRAAASNVLRRQRFVQKVAIQYNLCNEPWFRYSISIVADMGLTKPLYTSARLKKGEVLYLETHFNRYELCFNRGKVVCNGTMSTSSGAPEMVQEKLQNHNLRAQTGDRNLTDRENIIDVFRWSRCKKPLAQKAMLSYGIPLPVEHLEVLEENLDWEDVQWSETGVRVARKEYALARVHFLSPN